MIRWFRQYLTIARNAFGVCLSDPVYLVVMLVMLVLMLFFATLPTYNFGDELRLIRDQSLALTFIGGCVMAVVGTAAVIVRDMRQGTIAVLMSRPVSGLSFVFGKWSGIAAAITLYHLTLTLAGLWVTRIASVGGQMLDTAALAIYLGVILIALLAMAVKHYLFGGWYVWQASLGVSIGFAIGFVVMNFIGHDGLQAFGRHVDWPMLQGCLMLFLAELIFAGLLIPFAIRLDMVMVMVIGVSCFFLGLLSPTLVGWIAGDGFVHTAILALLPNWQNFWIADLLAEADGRIAGGFVVANLVHTLVYVCVCLLVAALIFNRREFSANDLV